MTNIYVYLSLNGQNKLLGTVHVDLIRGKETFCFEYAKDALDEKLERYLLDAEIHPLLGRQYKSDPSTPYHFMLDASPDRWGRRLVQRANSSKTLLESDYLLGVSDISRMGALRFSLSKNGPCLAELDEIPPFRFLNELEQAAYSYDLSADDDAWKILLSPGSSLGGARPKASIYDNDGALYLAKFANKHDDYDIPGVEYLTYRLATLCGVEMSPSKLIRTQDGHSVFLTKRFDRDGKDRLHYHSFMTLLNAEEGESSSYSYLDVAQIVALISASPEDDLEQLFRRIAFSLLVHNYDDHLRNHAMILRDKKWRLAPAFDLNVSFDKSSLTIPVSDEGSDIDALIETALYFGLSSEEGMLIIRKMKSTISTSLKTEAKKAGLADSLAKSILSMLAL